MKQENWVVLKFGGTSVASIARWQDIAKVVQQRKNQFERVLIVHSALSGVSNKLAELVKNPEKALYQQIIDQHLALAVDMGLNENVLDKKLAHLEDLFKRLQTETLSPYLEAEVMAMGELMATTLSAVWLEKQLLDVQWVDARTLLQTAEDDHRNLHSKVLSARCDSEPDSAMQETLCGLPGILLTQGFIAADRLGRTVLLGRGGSDTSASYLAARLNAKQLEIWTDVPGMFSANPRQISTARQLSQLGYDEAEEIASSGGKVLHPRCIGPVAGQKIPMHIYALNDPEAGGTIISDAPEQAPQVKAVSTRRGLNLVSMTSVRMWHQAGFLSDIFEIFKSHGLSVDLISTSQTNVTVSLDSQENVISEAELNAMRSDLEGICHVEVIPNCGAVTLVGRRMRAILHRLGPAMQALAEHRIYMMSQSSNDLNMTIVVNEDHTERLAKNLHRLLIGMDRAGTALGPTWEEIMNRHLPKQEIAPTWWREKRDQILTAEIQTPCYLYDDQTIKQAVKSLQSMHRVNGLFYAMKANSFPPVLRQLEKAGIGFECVSPNEIELILSEFPDIDRSRIIFTPNFAPRSEYEYGLDRDVMVTLDSLYPLQNWPETFAGKKVVLRLDPGHGYGHHKYVRTAGDQSKFGIAADELDLACELTQKLDIQVVAVHSHSGSGITQYENWLFVADYLYTASQKFPGCKVLDLGGGLGIQENPAEPGLDLAALNRGLSEYLQEKNDLKIWMEPGRYLVANAGVLLARVTQVKQKGDSVYVGVETGMNSLIRPALYGAYHEIINLTRIDEPIAYTATVVGPICETGDILGVDRQLPKCREGDILVIANTGAYGAAMASRYNLREPAREYMLSAVNKGSSEQC